MICGWGEVWGWDWVDEGGAVVVVEGWVVGGGGFVVREWGGEEEKMWARRWAIVVLPEEEGPERATRRVLGLLVRGPVGEGEGEVEDIFGGAGAEIVG